MREPFHGNDRDTEFQLHNIVYGNGDGPGRMIPRKEILRLIAEIIQRYERDDDPDGSTLFHNLDYSPQFLDTRLLAAECHKEHWQFRHQFFIGQDSLGNLTRRSGRE